MTDYVVTGAWSKKALEEGQKYTKANVAAKVGCVRMASQTACMNMPSLATCTIRAACMHEGAHALARLHLGALMRQRSMHPGMRLREGGGERGPCRHPACTPSLVPQGDNKSIPAVSGWKLSADSKYVHYCDNETIGGVEFKVCGRDGGALQVGLGLIMVVVCRVESWATMGGVRRGLGPA